MSFYFDKKESKLKVRPLSWNLMEACLVQTSLVSNYGNISRY